MEISPTTLTAAALSLLFILSHFAAEAQLDDDSSLELVSHNTNASGSTPFTVTSLDEDEEDQSEEDDDINSSSNRRSLLHYHYGSSPGRRLYYISYGALSANRIPCPPRSGRSYYTPDCHTAGGPVNPYSRGCSTITRCRS